jgi:hypothetical protein
MIEWIAVHPGAVVFVCMAGALGMSLCICASFAWTAYQNRKHREQRLQVCMADYRLRHRLKEEDEANEDTVLRRII